MTDQKGSVLLVSVIAISLFLLSAVFITKLIIANINGCKENINMARVFYLSEGGIETAKSKIAANPSWFTDNPFTGDDKRWLVYFASGETYALGSGGFKIVKENGKQIVYSVGYVGNDAKRSNYFSFKKMTYSLPFKQLRWECF